MTPLDLNRYFTFDTFVVGAGNRLACAAARRVAESPGTAYNPLFIYGTSGQGKTHLLSAIGQHAQRVHPDLPVVYDTLDHFMAQVMAAIEAGEPDAFGSHLGASGLLLLDDVQFLAGRLRTQEELIRLWDRLTGVGAQVVLASDRPPAEIDGLDDRLVSRLAGGLIVDIAPPEYETRVAIARRKAEERGQPLAPGVAEQLARLDFDNVRELQGALNRLIAVQELEGRSVAPDEVPELLGRSGRRTGDEFGAFLADISGLVADVVARSPAEQRLREAIRHFAGAGYRTGRLERALADPAALEDPGAVIAAFQQDVDRLQAMAAEILALDASAAELGRVELLYDPDRVAEAEALLGSVQDRMAPLPRPRDPATFRTLPIPADQFGVRAARAVAEQPGSRYNPLFVFGPPGAGKTALLAALGNELLEQRPDLPLAFVEGPAFAGELIEALERNRVESWRARYRRARILLVDQMDALAGTERAQEELFHLFDALHAAGAQLAFAARSSPRDLKGIEDRLRTRLMSGLVIELPPQSIVTPASPPEPKREKAAARTLGAATPKAAAPSSAPAQAAAAAPAPQVRKVADPWFLSREKVLWEWPYLEEVLIEELE